MTSGGRLNEAREADDNVVAIVGNRTVNELPTDLYIPPEALEVFLTTFEGPLDLLLYLIRRQNLDILEIRVHEIAEQYMRYIELMEVLQFELAAEYLVMAAMLAEIKSRLLLPRPESTAEEEEDPRMELIRRLQAYEQFKTAAERIDELPRVERDIHLAHVAKPALVARTHPDVDLKEMMIALAEVLHRAELNERHVVQLEPLSVRERMADLLSRLRDAADFVAFADLFDVTEGRRGIVVSFLALLELLREGAVDAVQSGAYAPIHVTLKRAT